MTEKELELIKLIRENDSPEKAIMTASVIIIVLLKQLESSAEQAPACQREHA